MGNIYNMDSTLTLLFAALRNFLSGESISNDIKDNISSQDLEALYQLADQHDIAHIVGDVLYKNGMLSGDEEVSKKFEQSQLTALFRYTGQDAAQAQIFQLFELEKITFIPLKGSIIRQYYPEPYMRTSCDLDILVPEDKLEDAKNCLVSQLGYTVNTEHKYHDVSLYSPKGVHVELHFSINENVECIDRLLSKVWQYAEDDETLKYQKSESPEYFIFHHISHMFYHFIDGGCGIRPFLDLYLLRQKMKYDEKTVLKMCEECNILKFYDTVKQLMNIWFGNQSYDEITRIMEYYILTGGVYGDINNLIAMKQNMMSSRIGFLISRVFLPYKTMKYRYPILEKHKWLYPVMTVWRWIESVLPSRSYRTASEFRALKDATEDSDNINKLMKFLEL